MLAALAFVGELLSVSFFLLFFSLGAVVALVFAALGAGLVVQGIAFVAATVLSMAVLRPALLNRLALRGGEHYAGHSITGAGGVVTRTIEPGGSGTVRIGGGEFWTARSLRPDERIKEGTRVRVLDTDGLTAVVEAMDGVDEAEGGESWR